LFHVKHLPDFQPQPFLTRLQDQLTSRWLGHRVHFYPQLESTNTTALDLASRGQPEGTVVLADRQLQGRGRRGRAWDSPPGLGLYCSVLLRPRLAPDRAPFLTLLTAVAVAQAVRHQLDLRPQIKWPNDLLIKGKKVAGILLESRVSPRGLEYVVMGIGVNVNQTPTDFAAALSENASSLRLETGATVARAELLARLFANLEELYENLQVGNIEMILEQWRHFSTTLNQPVRVVQNDRVLEGIAVDVTESGSLLVRQPDASLLEVQAGEIEHLRLA
jgi:BirA family biotin operon repressor/biotin-[acetyl-CoA-carboxylase] ligase